MMAVDVSELRKRSAWFGVACSVLAASSVGIALAGAAPVVWWSISALVNLGGVYFFLRAFHYAKLESQD